MTWKDNKGLYDVLLDMSWEFSRAAGLYGLY